MQEIDFFDDDLEDDAAAHGGNAGLSIVAPTSGEHVMVIPAEMAGQRVDKALALLLPAISRARLQALMAQGAVSMNGKPQAGGSLRVVGGEVIKIAIPEARPDTPAAQDIPLDILYEDDDLLVINKQAGLVVHPGAGNWDGTLVNALLHHCGDSLSGIGGVKRPGIVHRLDKETSGLMLVAKNDAAHAHLSEQLQTRTLSRTYWAFTVGVPLPATGVIDQPIDRHRTNRMKMAVLGSGRPARTHYRVLDNYGDKIGLVECTLETGRTHQIRVHMAHLRCCLLGDTLYGAQPTALNSALKSGVDSGGLKDQIRAFPRQALHAKAIGFIHPRTNREMAFETKLPADLQALADMLDQLFSASSA